MGSALNPVIGCPCRRKGGWDLGHGADAQVKMEADAGGPGYKTGSTGSHRSQKVLEGLGPSPGASEEISPAHTLILNFWSLEL